jgi:hydroxyacylglutathione hydrolase
VLGSPFPPLTSLAPRDVRRHLAEGAVLVDVRPVLSWAAGHVAGAIAIPLRPQFGSWLGWLVPDDRPLIFVLEAGQDADDLVRQARTIGYDQLIGAVVGSVDGWRAARLPVLSTEVVDAARVDRPVLDVRQDNEVAAGHVPGAFHVELGDVSAAASTLAAGDLAVMCGHGERAVTAASLLEGAGRRDVAVVLGGPDDWRAATGDDLQRG